MTTTDSNPVTPTAGCPGARLLHEFARGVCVSPQTQRHVDSCTQCRRRLEEMAAVDDFLGALTNIDKITSDDDSDCLAPDIIGGFVLHEEIGRGGQGVVYAALQEATQRRVAIKTLRRGAVASVRQRERFRREIQLAASLHHPNIVTIHGEVALADGRPAYFMQLVDGAPLGEWSRSAFRNSRRPADAAGRICRVYQKIAAATGFAHQKGVVHRDLKPSNVLVDEHDEPHILDFGIARSADDRNISAGITDADRDATATRTNEFVGTPVYAAPEQLAGGAVVDTRADIYALGVMLSESITGQRADRSPADARPLAHDLRAIVDRATHVRPEDRYLTALHLAEDLERFAQVRPVHARDGGFLYAAYRLVQRRPLRAAVALAVAVGSSALVLAVIALLSTIAARDSDIERSEYYSNIDRALSLIESGSFSDAEDLLWRAFLAPPAFIAESLGQAKSTGLQEHSAALWGLRTLYAQQPCIRTFRCTDQTSNAQIEASFSSDGSMLYVVSNAQTVDVWDWNTAQRLRSIPLGDAPSPRIRILPNANAAAYISADDQSMLTLVDLSSGRRESVSMPPDMSADTNPRSLHIAESRGGALVLVGNSDGDLLVLDRSNSAQWRFSVPVDEAVVAVDFDDAPGRALVVTETGSFIVVDLVAQNVVRTQSVTLPPDVRTDSVVRAYVLPARAGLALTGTRVVLADRRTGRADYLAWHSQAFKEFAQNRDSGLVATALDNEILVRHTEGAMNTRLVLRGHRHAVSSLSIHPSREILASVDVDGFVRIWDIREERSVRYVDSGSSTVFAVDFSPEGDRVALGDANGALTVVDWESRTPLLTLPDAHAGMISRIAYSPDGDILATGGSKPDPTLRLWDAQSGEHLQSLDIFGGRVTGARFSADGRYLAAAGLLRAAIINMHETPMAAEAQWDVDRYIRGIDLAPDGTAIAFTTADKIFVGETSGSALTPLPRNSTPRHIAFSPDGRRIVADGGDSVLTIYDSRSNDILGQLVGHSMRDHSLDFHPEGRLLLSAGEDEALKVWDTHLFRCLATFGGARGDVFSARFSPDGRRAATGDTAGFVTLWDFASLDASIAGNLAANIEFAGESMPTERLRRLSAWAADVSDASRSR